MSWIRRNGNGKREAKRFAFVQCPGCSYNFLTGEGSKSCNWYDCPYLPEELKVFCPACNYNFATGDGDRGCENQSSCEWASAGFRKAREARRFFGEPSRAERR